MTAPSPHYWILVAARALPAAIVALVITFSADHGVRLGALSLGVFALVTAAILIPTAVRELSGVVRKLVLGQGVVLAIGALLAFIGLGAQIAYLLFLTVAVFVVSGILELVAGLRARGTFASARDWIFVGGASIVFGLAMLLVPVDYSQPISIPDKVVPNLTASVIVVGSLGAYTAIVAVYLVIAALSLKWAPTSGALPVEPSPTPSIGKNR